MNFNLIILSMSFYILKISLNTFLQADLKETKLDFAVHMFAVFPQPEPWSHLVIFSYMWFSAGKQTQLPRARIWAPIRTPAGGRAGLWPVPIQANPCLPPDTKWAASSSWAFSNFHSKAEKQPLHWCWVFNRIYLVSFLQNVFYYIYTMCYLFFSHYYSIS